MDILVVKWGADYEDLLPKWILSIPFDLDFFLHEVRYSNGKIRRARCTVRVLKNKIELDYQPFRKYNEEQLNFIGVLTLTLSNSKVGSFPSVYWRGIGKSGGPSGPGTLEIESVPTARREQTRVARQRPQTRSDSTA